MDSFVSVDDVSQCNGQKFFNRFEFDFLSNCTDVQKASALHLVSYFVCSERVASERLQKEATHLSIVLILLMRFVCC